MGIASLFIDGKFKKGEGEVWVTRKKGSLQKRADEKKTIYANGHYYENWKARL